MSTSTLCKATSFRLPSELLEELKERTKATNCRLNNYVESILTYVFTIKDNLTLLFIDLFCSFLFFLLSLQKSLYVASKVSKNRYNE